MEEIDIIELLRRVKEGKAPNRLYIEDYGYYTCDYDNMNKIKLCYVRDDGQHWYIEDFDFDTKIKILDKPIIEELSENDMFVTVKVGNKINEIIKWIKEKN